VADAGPAIVDAVDAAKRLAAHVRARLEALEGDSALNEVDRARVAASLSTTLVRLAKLTESERALQRERVIREDYERGTKIILAAVARHGQQAMIDVAEALERADAELERAALAGG
jgi:hypothetical protein